MGMVIRFKVSLFLFTLLSLLCFHPLFLHAANSITQHESIKDGATLVSEGLKFEMGFFSLDNSSLRYVGIWYYEIPSSSHVWVANRNQPIEGRGGSITIKNEGNLVVLDGQNNEVWSSNVSIPMNNSQVVLHDDGNLVLSDTQANKEVWQSFEDLTDTYLPGMKVPATGGMSEETSFRAWKSATDPSLGKYTMTVDSEASPQIVIFEGEKRRWRSGYWDGRVFSGVPNMTGSYLFGFRLNKDDKGGRYFVYDALNNTDKIRFQIGWDGYERQFRWNEDEKTWTVLQTQPYNQCEFYNSCGSFAVCDVSDSSSVCSCIHGFEPRDTGNWSEGCKRMTPLKAERGNSSSLSVGEDGFLVQRDLKLPDFAHLVSVVDSEDCKRNCIENSSCAAYVNVVGIGCKIWYGELVDVQHLENYGITLNIRLAHSDLVKEKSSPFTFVFASID